MQEEPSNEEIENPEVGQLEYQWKDFDVEINREICYLGVQVLDPQELNQATRPVVHNQKKRELELPNTNRLDMIAEDIMMRYKKYGGLDVNSKIARKTGAYKRDENNERDINYYDQDDPFIDDSEVQEQNQQNKMALPEAGFSDFFCIGGDLKFVMETQEYRDRICVIEHLGNNERQEVGDIKKVVTMGIKRVKKTKQLTNGLDQAQCLLLQSILKSQGAGPQVQKKEKKVNKSSGKQIIQEQSSKLVQKEISQQINQKIIIENIENNNLVGKNQLTAIQIDDEDTKYKEQ